MSKELTDILSLSDENIDPQRLLNYINNKLSADEKHELEKEMVDSPFLNDALEGLQHFDNKKELTAFVNELNANLHKQLDARKRRKLKQRIKDQPWVWLAIVLILFLTVICFLVVRYMLHG